MNLLFKSVDGRAGGDADRLLPSDGTQRKLSIFRRQHRRFSLKPLNLIDKEEVLIYFEVHGTWR